jgi:ShK domain-like
METVDILLLLDLWVTYQVQCTIALPMIHGPWLLPLLLLTASFTITFALAVEEEECVIGEDGICEPICNDKHSECKAWAAVGECAQNPRFMLFECQSACNMCGKTVAQIETDVVQALETKEKEEQRLEELVETPAVLICCGNGLKV